MKTSLCYSYLPNEMERVNQAFEEELQFLQEQIEEEEDPRVIKSLVNKMIKLRQKIILIKFKSQVLLMQLVS